MNATSRDEAADALIQAMWAVWQYDDDAVPHVTEHEFMTFVRVLIFLSNWPEFRALLVACIEDGDRSDGTVA